MPFHIRKSAAIVGASLVALVGVGSPVSVYAERYSGLEKSVVATETFSFANKVTDQEYMLPLIPVYTITGGNSGCVPIAGACLIGYYDIYCTDLVPNYNTSFTYNGTIYMKGQGSEIDAVIEELYDRMGTDVGGAGTTVSGFVNGMNSYVSAHGGYSISYASSMSGSSFNMTTFKNLIAQKKPVVLFLDGYIYVDQLGFSTEDTSEKIITHTNDEAHACVAYGWTVNKYYNSNNVLFRTDTYLKVSFGNGSYGYIRINDSSNIDNAYGITIS